MKKSISINLLTPDFTLIFDQMENDFLKINISPTGAELTSILDRKTGFEFLWQADPSIWARHAPVLFPIVGKVKDNQLRFNGHSFPMNQHGFARDQLFTQTMNTATECWFLFTNDDTTQSVFPFKYELQLGYTLTGNTLHCHYKVLNTDHQTLYFSIGAHPGFNLPTHQLNEYEIVFEQEEKAERHLLSGGLFNGTTKPVFSTPTSIKLSTEIFDDDAIVLKNLNSKRLKLKHLQRSFEIALSFDGFPYMGIWTQKNCSQFICLEPWCGLADSIDGHTDLPHKEGIIQLEAGGLFERSYALTFTP